MKRSNYRNEAFGLLALALFSPALWAATCTSIATGNWNTASTWSCTGAVTRPGAADSVIIVSPHTVTLDGNRSATNLQIDAGATLNDGAGRDLTLSGNALINGTYDATGNNGNLTMTGSGVTLSGSGTIIDIGLLEIDGNVTVSAGSNLSLTLGSEIRIGNNNPGTLTIDGTLDGTAMSNGTRLIRLDNNNTSNMIVNGSINAPNSFIEVQSGGTVTNNGSVSVQYLDGNNNATSTWTQGAGSGLTMTQPAAQWVGTFNAHANGNTVTYNGTSTVIAPSAGYWNLAGTIFPGACPVAYTILGSSPCVGVPTVVTNPATAMTTTGATLNGSVSSNGASTTVSFDYGLTVAYGTNIAATPSSLAAAAANTAVSATVAGLTCGTTYHFRAKGVNSYGTTNGNDRTFVTSACPPAPMVVSINTASANPTAANTVVSWTVLFNDNMTGVDASDFILLASGGVTGSGITGVSGSGTTYTVTANTGTGTVGTLTLRLVDNDSIINASSTPLGGAGAGNGSFTGQAYTLIIPVCTPGLLFCDDFERSVIAGGANAANTVGTAPGYGAWTVGPLGGGCAGVVGNRGCAGIDSDIPPFSTPANPRANSTRALYTRWTNVMVTSPVIDLAGKGGARLSFWLRRGSDCFSEWPSNNTWHTFANCTLPVPGFTPTSGEEFQVQYLNNVGTWVVLAQYPMDDAPGEILVPVIGLPDDALHAGFQFRFVQPGGSGSGATTGGAPGVRGYDYWHVDNVVLEEVPGVSFAGPFCDNFEGDLSRWDMAGTGNVRIGSTWFQNGAHNMDLRWNTVSATTKATDLSTNSGNDTITFWVKRGTGIYTTLPNGTGSEYPDTVAKGLRVEYLNNLGAWVLLSNFAGAGTQGQVFSPTLTPATNSFAIPANAKHANFKLRVRMLAGSGLFDQDYWHVDDVCVGSTVGSTDLGVAMSSGGTFSPGQYVTYTMVVTNYGPNADPGPITITDTLPVGLTYVGGSAGWTCSAAGQVVTCTQAGGLAANATTTLTITATVDAGASGTVTNSATVGGQTNDSSLGNNTASKTDTIFVPGYVFTDRACTLDGTPVDSGAQCNTIAWSPQTAGTPLGSIYITVVDAANVPIQLHGTNPTTVNVQFGLSCISPLANAGVQATFYDATTTTLPLCTSNGAIPTGWSASRALVFPAVTASVGPFSFNYNDVGSVELFMRNAAVTTQMGRSTSFVVKPAGFVLSAIERTSDNYANPAAANAAGLAFVKAGEAFGMTVTAVTSLGVATPNYGNEFDVLNNVAAPESVKLTPLNVVANMKLPVDAVNGSFGTFTSGVATGTNFTWPEVGIIRLNSSVGDGDYLGAGDVITLSGNVGRFYPDHFDTVVSQVSGVPMDCPLGVVCPTAYDGFVYSGQSFTLTVSAKNVGGVTTANYNTATGFSRTAALSVVTALGTDGALPVADTLAVPGLSAFADGVASTNAEQYVFGTVPTAPTNIYIRATETVGGDGVTSKRLVNPTLNSIEGGVAVVSGRLKVSNAYGSELLPLTLMATAQYYTSGGWLNSIKDSITHLTVNASYPVGSGTTAVTLTPSSGDLLNGSLTIRLGKPTAGAGTADVNPGAPSYLPVTPGTATFGVYKSNNNFIYRREN
jgi:uncharacterized repeat protein (TIGR01451 family)